jgi:biopolymer transport protein ExbB
MKTLIAIGAFAALIPSFANAWWDEAWTARRTVTLDTSAAGVPVGTPQNAVPVAIRLHSGNFDFLTAKDDGSDLRFVAADDKTVLKHHIERYDALNELAVVWVQVPLVASGDTPATLYAYFGNAAVGGVQDSKATFDASTVGVWHFSDPTPWRTSCRA